MPGGNMANATESIIVLGEGVGNFLVARWLKTPTGKRPAPPLALPPRPAPPDFAELARAEARRFGFSAVVLGKETLTVE